MTGRADVTEKNRHIARTVAEVFGGAPVVHTWWDDEKKNSVDILSCKDSPAPGVTAYATVNLSNKPLTDTINDLRVELLGACRSDVEDFPGLPSFQGVGSTGRSARANTVIGGRSRRTTNSS